MKITHGLIIVKVYLPVWQIDCHICITTALLQIRVFNYNNHVFYLFLYLCTMVNCHEEQALCFLGCLSVKNLF